MSWTDHQIEDAAQAFEDFDPADATVIDMSDIRAISEVADRIDHDQALLTERVAVARAHGRSWTQIADALGVSRQAARQRFAAKAGGENDA